MTPPPVRLSYAQLLRDFRVVVAWSQRDLADAIPVTVRTLQRWESGEVRAPVPIIRQRVTAIMQAQGYPKAS